MDPNRANEDGALNVPGKIDLYNLGSLGVDLTKSPIHGPDGSLTSCQNAVPNTRGETGGLAKRDGLVAINSSTAGGSVQGVIQVGLRLTQTVYVGLVNGGHWYSSTDAFATQPTQTSGSGPPADVGSPTQVGSSSGGLFSAVVNTTNDTRLQGENATVWNNQLFYAGNPASAGGFTQGTTAPNIRVFDGSVDREFALIPINPSSGVVSWAIFHMMTEANSLYVATQDSGAIGATLGSVYKLNPVTGGFTKLGATFPAGFPPFCLTWYQGKLWAGTFSGDATQSGRVYWIRPDIDTAWTLDNTSAAGQGEITAITQYAGNLYTANWGSTGLAGLVRRRDTAGTWTTSQTGPTTAAAQGYISLRVFGANLYASYFDNTNNTWQIEKFNDTSWSTVNSASLEDAYFLYTDGATLYAFDGSNSGSPTLLITTNGTSWTARSLGSWSSPAAAGQGSAFGVLTL